MNRIIYNTIFVASLMLAVAGCRKHLPYLSPNPDYNKAVLERTYVQVISTGWDSTVVDSMIDSKVVMHFPDSTSSTGIQAFRDYIRNLHIAFPDAKANYEDLYADSDRVIGRYNLSGTMKGSYWGLPPTNRTFSVEGYTIVRVFENKIFQYWGMLDEARMCTQLGLPCNSDTRNAVGTNANP